MQCTITYVFEAASRRSLRQGGDCLPQRRITGVEEKDHRLTHQEGSFHLAHSHETDPLGPILIRLKD